MAEQYEVGQLVEWYATKAGRIAKVTAKYIGTVPLPDGQRPALIDSKLWVYQTPMEFPRASTDGWYTVTVGGEFYTTLASAVVAAKEYFGREAEIADARKRSMQRDTARILDRMAEEVAGK